MLSARGGGGAQADGYWVNRLYYDASEFGTPVITDQGRMSLDVDGARNVTHTWAYGSVRRWRKRGH